MKIQYGEPIILIFCDMVQNWYVEVLGDVGQTSLVGFRKIIRTSVSWFKIFQSLHGGRSKNLILCSSQCIKEVWIFIPATEVFFSIRILWKIYLFNFFEIKRKQILSLLISIWMVYILIIQFPIIQYGWVVQMGLIYSLICSKVNIWKFSDTYIKYVFMLSLIKYDRYFI